MKKVAFLTSYYVNNYGTVLQAFATQELLKSLETQPELIKVEGFWKEISRKRRKYFLMAAFTSSFGIDKFGKAFNRILVCLKFTQYAKNIHKRDTIYENFRRKNLQFSPVYESISKLTKEVEERYDTVIVGSDQLWLPSNIVGDFFTLSFVPQGIKKISYATSFGRDNIPPEYQQKVKDFLLKIDCLSVREDSGKRIIKEICSRDASVVLDPVLMLSKEKWDKYIDDHSLLNEEYILCYFLGKRKEGRECAKKLKKITGIGIVCLPHLDEYIWCDDIYADKTLYEVSPFDFINLIRNAKFVLTDSFHCVAFSILYNKDFFAFRRYSAKKKYSTNGRIDSLLESLSVESRIADSTNDSETIHNLIYKKIDYDAVNKRLEVIRMESRDFIIRAMGIISE